MWCSWVALSREESEAVRHGRKLGRLSKEQPNDNALTGEEDAVRQKQAQIGIAAARAAARVLHPDLAGETADYHEEVGVHRGRTVVPDPIDVLLPPAPSAVRLDPHNIQLR